MGIDITYLAQVEVRSGDADGAAQGDRSPADRHPASAWLWRDDVRADCRRRCAGCPTILHEHANLTDTPWFQKIADEILEPSTDIAIAVSKSTADFVINARLVPPRTREGGVPGRAARGIQPAAHGPGDRRGAARARRRARRIPVGTVTRLHDSKGNAYLVDAAQAVLQRAAAKRGSSCSAKGRSEPTRGPGAGARVSGSLRLRRLRARRRRARCRRSTSACSRRSGRARRSRCSRRWRWGSRSSRPTPTDCSTC